MKAERVRPIGRAGRKHTRERIFRIRSRMDLEDVSSRAMKPSDDENLVTHGEAAKRRGGPALDFEPGVRPAFGSLFRRALPIFKRRSDDAHGSQPSAHAREHP